MDLHVVEFLIGEWQSLQAGQMRRLAGVLGMVIKKARVSHSSALAPYPPLKHRTPNKWNGRSMPGRQEDSKRVDIKQLGCEDSRVRLHSLSGRWKENSQIRLDPCDTGSKVEAAHLQ